MSKQQALLRVFAGLVIIGLLYGAPHLIGTVTAGSRLSPCLRNLQSDAQIVVKLAFIPGPTEIEELQRYGRYGGSGGDIHNVVLSGVPPRNQQLLAQLYWIKEVAPVRPCQ